jgi:hypothetical protein
VILIDSNLHSEEIEKIEYINCISGISFKTNNLILENLNYLEQLGLYLIGQISRGRLCELWGSEFLCASEIVCAVDNGINEFVKNNTP